MSDPEQALVPRNDLVAELEWNAWMPKLYASRKGPEPLGTVVFEEIEEKARQKLKDYPGTHVLCTWRRHSMYSFYPPQRHSCMHMEPRALGQHIERTFDHSKSTGSYRGCWLMRPFVIWRYVFFWNYTTLI